MRVKVGVRARVRVKVKVRGRLGGEGEGEGNLEHPGCGHGFQHGVQTVGVVGERSPTVPQIHDTRA